MATHSTMLGWRIPWTQEPGGLQSMGPQRVGHDCATNTVIDFSFTFRAGGSPAGHVLTTPISLGGLDYGTMA